MTRRTWHPWSSRAAHSGFEARQLLEDAASAQALCRSASSALKVVVVGDFAVGKTATVQRWCTGDFTNAYKATIAVDFFYRHLSICGAPVTMHVWDTAGQERFASLARNYFHGAHGARASAPAAGVGRRAGVVGGPRSARVPPAALLVCHAYRCVCSAIYTPLPHPPGRFARCPQHALACTPLLPCTALRDGSPPRPPPCAVAIIGFDMSRHETLASVQQRWVKDIREYARDDARIVVVGMKSDIGHIAMTSEAMRVAQDTCAEFFTVSAKTGTSGGAHARPAALYYAAGRGQPAPVPVAAGA